MTKEQFKAYLATGRVSNLPTVWCQVYTALVLSYPIFNQPVITNNFAGLAITLSFLASFFYIGGCFLGDAFDFSYDKKYKPNRPLPSGVLQRGNILIIGLFLIITAWAAASYLTPLTFILAGIQDSSSTYGISINKAQGVCATALAALILSYAYYHKAKPRIGLILMGLCRSFLILYALSSSTVSMEELFSHVEKQPLQTIAYPIGVFIFTIAFAKVAQLEHDSSAVNRFWYTPYFLGPFICISGSTTRLGKATQIGTSCILLAWLIFFCLRFIPHQKGKFVGNSIAGFCLIDACVLSFVNCSISYIIICFILFGLTLLAQRFSPAT